MKKFGYLGLVKSSDFINGETLAKKIGLEEGKPQYSNCDWMHFILNDQDIMVPVKPLRFYISWQQIYQAGAVYSDTEGFGPYPVKENRNQNQFVTINGVTYKVTLLKGSNGDNQTHILGFNVDNDPSFYSPQSTWDSEWNQLMYRVHDGVHNPYHSNSTITSHPYGVWEQFSDADLGLDYSKNKGGTTNWCQEKGTWTEDAMDRRVSRGCGVTFVTCPPVFHSSSNLGWRPALRKI